MADTRGVWGLSEAWGEKSTNSWVPVSQVWMPNDGFGYSMHQLVSRLTRTNINTGIAYNSTGDQVYNPASHGGTGFSSGDKGYFLGSSPSPGTSWVGKVTYATGVHEDPYYSPGGPYMPSPGYVMGSFPGNTKGYVFGGAGGFGGYATAKMEYSNESWASVPGSIAWVLGGQWYITGDNNGNGVGYAIAGQQPYGQYGGGKLPYSTETWSTYPASPGIFPIGTGAAGGFGNKTNSYLTGGAPGSWASTIQTATYKFTYSSETWARNPSANLILGLVEGASYGFNSSKGCICGGVPHGAYNPSNPNPYKNSQAFTLTYSTDTWDATSIAADSDKFGSEKGTGVSAAQNHSPSPGMDGFSRWMDGAGETPDSGYAVSGRNSPSPQGHSTTSKIDFTSDTSSATPALDSYYSCSYNFGAGSTTNGYVIGGTDGSPSDGESGVTKITYSTETKSDLGGALGARRYACFAMTHGNTALYAGGGRNPDSSTIFKMNYSDETFAVLPTVAGAYTSMVPLRHDGASSATATKGYFLAGNRIGSPNSSVGKLDFANDTFQDMGYSKFPVNTVKNRAISESTAAYSMGGRAGQYWYNSNDTSTITKLTYSSETVSNIPETLTSVRYNTFTMGNQTQGYVAGGESYSGGYHSKVEKFVYSTSTISAISSLPGNQSQGSGISPRNDNLFPEVISKTTTTTPTSSTSISANPALSVDGYLSGGVQSNQAPTYSITDKITFATDTTARVPGSNTTPGPIYAAAGHSSPTTGYTSGGNEGSVPGHPGSYSYTRKTRKLVYASGSYSQIPGADSMSFPKRYLMYAVNSPNFAYIGGGQSQPGAKSSTWDKFNYATETCEVNSINTKDIFQNNGHVESAASGTALGNHEYGYICGGDSDSTGTVISSIYKITYAVDDVTEMPSSSMTIQNESGQNCMRYFSFGNGTHGYVCGGESANSKAVNKLTYATDTTSFAPDLWGVARMAEAVSSNTAGYISGLYNTSWGGYKMPYSTETWTQGPGLTLATQRHWCAGFNAGMNGNAFTDTPNVI